jgi:uncharacterized protein (TIGR02996 family)
MAPRKVVSTPPDPRPEVLAFLDAIKDDPDDDAARLVLADWLDEHGDEHDAARGRYLRLSCELRKLPEDDARRATIDDELGKLRKRHESAWLGPLAGVQSARCTVSVGAGGMLRLAGDAVSLNGKRCQAVTPTEAFAWVDTLKVTEGYAPVLKVLASPLLRKLNVLDLHELEIHPGGAKRLAARAELSSLVGLDLEASNVQADGVKALADSPAFTNLQWLNLKRASLSSKCLPALAASPGLRRLRSLDLGSHNLGDSVRHLAQAEWLAGLESLLLRCASVNDAGVVPIVASPRAANLKSLDLPGNPITDATLEAIAASPHLGRLTDLNLSTNVGKYREAGFQALTASPLFGRLRTLNVSSSTQGASLARLLADSPHWSGFERLDLSCVPIGDEGAEALAAAAQRGAIGQLDLGFCRIGDAGAAAIGEAMRAGRIQRASLAVNREISSQAQTELRREFGERIQFKF